LQLATCCLAESTVFDFLNPVADRKDQEIATHPWRVAVVQPAPFDTQVIEAERPDAIELALDRWCGYSGHN
jgi:hypothetical protein